MDWNEIILAFVPAISLILTVILELIRRQAKEKVGIELEEKDMRVMHSALMNGAMAALSKGMNGEAAMAYAKNHFLTGSPETARRVNPAVEVLNNLASAKLIEAAGKLQFGRAD